MTAYLIENCDSNKFPAILRAIEEANDYVSTKGIITIKEKPDRLRVYSKYHIEKLGQDQYIDIRFHASSISIETNCSESRMSPLVDKITNFSVGNLTTIDDTVTAEPLAR